MMFFENSHCVTQITIPNIIPGSCELLLVRDVAATHSWLLVYRPPDCNVGHTRLLFDVINQIASEYPNYIVLGDFNMPKIKWSQDEEEQLEFAEQHDTLSFEFLDLCAQCDLYQVVPQPTHRENFLDLILTSTLNIFSSIEVHPPVLTSVHDSVPCHIMTVSNNRQQQLSHLDFRKADYTAIAQQLTLIDWSMLFANCTDIDEFWDIFVNQIQRLVLQYVPFNRRDARTQSNALPRAIKRLIRKKRQAWKRLMSALAI